MGVLFTLALPQFANYRQSSCMTKLQLQVFNFKLALKKQINQQGIPNIDLMALYTNLDLKPSNCSFQTQKNGFVAINGDKQISFIVKNGILECQPTKSARLHNNESLCDVF